MRDVKLGSKFKYDGELCFAMYMNYKDGIVTDDELVTYVKRYALMYVQSHYRRLGPDVCDDLLQSALMSVWSVIKKQNLPEKDVNTFHSYLNTVIRRAVSREFGAVYGQSLSELSHEQYDSGLGNRDVTPGDVEDRIFLEELPEAIVKAIRKKIRFSEPEWREATEYILERMMSNRRVVTDLIKRQWRLNNPQIKFLRDHVSVMIRDTLYGFKQYVKFTKPRERRDVLWDSFERAVWSPES
jgi:hypothetical protein